MACTSHPLQRQGGAWLCGPAMAFVQLLFICLSTALSWEVLAGRPFNVSYDSRAITIDGKRQLIISAGIHYPRATSKMWPGLLRKAKDGGANVIETYVFWNGHEPVKRKYHFGGRYNLVKFVKLVEEAGLMLFLRIGPYVCAEWNFGGLPVWLRDVPGIEFRTNNTFFQEEMSLFVEKIVRLMKDNHLFSWQGGPIILAQIENEYGDIEHSFGDGGKNYVHWAAALAQSVNIGVPWVMCKQNDAPAGIINSCNGFYCDGFRPNSNEKPVLWTEDWAGWYSNWGEPVPWRPVEDNAFAIARFFQRGGSFHNYYMFFGGTNFGHTSGGPFVTTSYDYDAPIDEYGLLRQPKWGHLRELHIALKLCEDAMFAANIEPLYVKLGPKQEAHVYGSLERDNLQVTSGVCAAFLANIDPNNNAKVLFNGNTYELPAWSVSILPDCKNVVFNSAKVSAQTSSIHMMRLPVLHTDLHRSMPEAYTEFSSANLSWEFYKEPVGTWSNNSLVFSNLVEHLMLTKDSTDYLWYICRFEVSSDDKEVMKESGLQPVLFIEAMRDALSVFINGKFSGFTAANNSQSWVKVEKRLQLEAGWNEIALLSSTIGLQNYGAFLERDGAGLQGQILVTGFPSRNLNLTNMEWIYEVGLQGEFYKLFDQEGKMEKAWSFVESNISSPITWYKTYFDAPIGNGPFALDLNSMGKGEVWLNGKSLGRYWPALHIRTSGCTDTCNYRGTYSSSKCLTGCGQPTQRWYHVPRSWMKKKDNLLVLFEEIGGDVSEVSLMLRYQRMICIHLSENQPTTNSWLQSMWTTNGKLLAAPKLELTCQEGFLISEISFASFGNPSGQCGGFQQGLCHSKASRPSVENACLGHQRCQLDVAVESFGEDPCPGIEKSLAVEATCTHELGFRNENAGSNEQDVLHFVH